MISPISSPESSFTLIDDERSKDGKTSISKGMSSLILKNVSTVSTKSLVSGTALIKFPRPFESHHSSEELISQHSPNGRSPSERKTL